MGGDGGGREGGEGGTKVPSGRSTYKNNPPLVRHRRKIVLSKVTCNSWKAGQFTVGRPGRRWGAGGGDEGKRDGEGEGQEEGEGAVPSNSMAL